MDKKPKYEREFGKGKEPVMQELSSTVYQPPKFDTAYNA